MSLSKFMGCVIIAVVCMVVSTVMMSCGCEVSPAKEDVFFQGDHELRELTYLGADTVKTVNPTKIRFCWKGNDGTWIMTALPYNKVRFSEDGGNPYCKFRWDNWRIFDESEWWESVIYVVLNVDSKEYQKYLRFE